ncbi:hypothetical protein AB9N12_18035 [Bacteroides sp. AN502(2024)]|uniref:hypothetical protein n=1 Tax=Bacteroides sp. AN502(2024) TaxID=3160599 RepID=UPI003517ADF6
MKSTGYFLFSLVILLATNEALACWGPWYSPEGYYMYRVHNSHPKAELEIKGCYPGANRNCKEWQKLTSHTIPLKDIYHVVYEMPLEEFELLYDNKATTGNNKFVKWITQRDTSILDFLLLAKTNEYIRLKRNSRWYYPSMKIGARMTLEEIAEKSLSVNDARLRDRYLLQGIRALFSLARYEECIDFWESEVTLLSENNLMRQLIYPYIVGAEFHIKRSEKAMEYFAQLGDVQSMLFCAGRTGEKLSTVEALELVCEYAPNSNYIAETLQEYVRKLEPLGEFDWNPKFEVTTEQNKLYSLCLKMAGSGRSDNPATWYYTAAFLADLKGETTKASYLLELAENSRSSEFINESVQVFRMYLDAKLQPYNSAYENKLFSQLKWLDLKITENIDENVRLETARGYMLSYCESYYYWNDMMRRILLAEVCPRMIKAGKTIRALQLANMADNRLLNLVNKQELDEVNGKHEYMPVTYTMSEYRYSNNFNSYDYSNHFFEMIDSLGVNTAIKYVQCVQKPKSEFDRYLNARSYTGTDYLNDIIGTLCLRNMRYAEAVEYLGAVSKAYKKHLNVHMGYDPFSVMHKKRKIKSNFRYDFARRMYSLEQKMSLTTEPNHKAQLMVRYAIGLQNSFNWCWEITQYYKGASYLGQVCKKRDWENDEYTTAAKNRAKQLIRLACEIVTDDKVAANIHYELCNFKMVANKYPNTEKGQLVKGKCDSLYDYNLL